MYVHVCMTQLGQQCLIPIIKRRACSHGMSPGAVAIRLGCEFKKIQSRERTIACSFGLMEQNGTAVLLIATRLMETEPFLRATVLRTTAHSWSSVLSLSL